METIELAKTHLIEEQQTLVLVKEQQVVFQSNEKGIKALHTLYKNDRKLLQDAVLADTVIGKAAAMICVECGIKEIYASLISDTAIEVLEKHLIPYSYAKKVSFIKNRDQSDLCPMEKIALGAESTEQLMINIEAFFEKMKQAAGTAK